MTSKKQMEHCRRIAKSGGVALVEKHGKAHMRKIGSKGGKAVFKRYGREYMQQIGRAGMTAFREKYMIVPAHLTQYAIVDRITNEVVGYLSGEYFKGKLEESRNGGISIQHQAIPAQENFM